MVISNSNGNSDWLETNLGVPQRSVLGALLFSLQIYLHTPKDKFQECVTRLADATRLVSERAESSGLRLNPDQTRAIFFCSRKTSIH